MIRWPIFPQHDHSPLSYRLLMQASYGGSEGSEVNPLAEIHDQGNTTTGTSQSELEVNEV